MKKFKKVYIEITNNCNLSCSFCPETTRVKKFMDLELFNKVLDEIKPYTDYIYLHIKGEPLLHPKMSEFLDVAHLKGFKVNITTNGTLILKVKDKLINKPALRQINFSIHSLSSNSSINKDEYLLNIINISKEFSLKGVYISFRLWNLQNNIINNENKLILSFLENELNLDYKITDKLQDKLSLKIKDNIYLNLDNEFQWPSLGAQDLGNKGFCYGLRTHLGILVDGTVVPCCLDGDGIINLGNINKSSFEEIINNDRAKNIIGRFSKRIAIEELCQKCGYRTKMN